MSIIENTWAGKRIYRTRPNFMEKSNADHPFDYSYCIFGYRGRSKIEDVCINFIGLTGDGKIVTQSGTNGLLWVLDRSWNDGFWEIAPDTP